MTAILEPFLQSPRDLASLMAWAITWSVPWNVSILWPIAPLIEFVYLTTYAFIEQAKILTSGLYLAVSLANLPDSVKTITN